ncbi:hypothetical protein CAOG_09048 [Capsaspora owczarzaki ATCC 30864]|uniref:FYVE-type domain-containing protein n=1 Tax=Capsaspora owczarzaki (strain ATCC 30864) TaxID=595528 RepID=A0A0D2X4Z7_CAPO3|nr:hypothetical protein CAOG_09048 [Capsaspora owczarzaki ATCC 30864]KJE96929.1 hypothetical protein CAOG_009048 [Capsaspora owczarzaki ATCC 30864]|eukprot:XP_011270736.1 hypothetical protein CAOG_09048 [Capsaspora owczarzaki ATCC 30864]
MFGKSGPPQNALSARLSQPAATTYDQQQLARSAGTAGNRPNSVSSGAGGGNSATLNGILTSSTPSTTRAPGQAPQAHVALQQQQDSMPVVTKAHWKPDALATRCPQPGCGVSFSLLERRHHCRKCGDIYCEKHVKFEMRLNAQAKPDPQRGVLCSVCQFCFQTRAGHQQEPGQTRSLTRAYIGERQRRLDLRANSIDRIVTVVERLAVLKNATPSADLDKEQASIVRWMPDISAIKCPFCGEAFGMFFTRRHHCRLCGRVVCTGKGCSRDVVHKLDARFMTLDGREPDRDAMRLLLPSANGTPPMPSMKLLTCGDCMWYCDYRRRRMDWQERQKVMECMPILEAYDQLTADRVHVEQLLFQWDELDNDIQNISREEEEQAFFASLDRQNGLSTIGNAVSDGNFGVNMSSIDPLDFGVVPAEPQSAAPPTLLDSLSQSKKALRKQVMQAFSDFQDRGTMIRHMPTSSPTESRLQEMIYQSVILYIQQHKFSFAARQASA